MISAFVAYPTEPARIGITVDELIGDLKGDPAITLVPWPMLNVQGLRIDSLVREKIRNIDFLLADITYPNFNVYYEMGYCLGCRKPCVPMVNITVDTAVSQVNLTGLFDTWGQIRYQNAGELKAKLKEAKLEEWTSAYIHAKDHSQPLFVLDMEAKTDFRNWIFQTIANSSIEMRRHDPIETPRLFLHSAISDVSSSAGVIVPLISEDTVDSLRHNLKAAFLAGLAHGYDIEPLILQFEDRPAPVDFRDLLDTVRGRNETAMAVGDYCQTTLIKNQRPGLVARKGRATLLQQLDLGSSRSRALEAGAIFHSYGRVFQSGQR
jgi:hypothetical protein